LLEVAGYRFRVHTFLFVLQQNAATEGFSTVFIAAQPLDPSLMQ
jgi:hypothetical protein